MAKKTINLHDDLMDSDETTEFLFGSRDKKAKRKFYYLAGRRLPVLRLGGSRIYTRRSVLIQFCEQQEQKNSGLIIKTTPEDDEGPASQQANVVPFPHK